ncbi:MAG: EEP domain-containing protein [Xanthomonadales bacterium]|nr:EEP domain-containing protein [Xanthomonadales bacterium]NIN58223.1 EEP domain-containing protein [Xanthomonadales bacterium]NIN73567.1 EEP domain-containing protein [Xanthomonadales bacterium]NIO13698.1 EEP domain-containing protein [Xanthomonadales bacterium]NIP10616.1 EEP domain-containing protein [Xanthomonadales bacterium]
MTYNDRKRLGPGTPDCLRLLSFNIHAGTTTDRFHQYVTHSWRQVLPHHQRVRNLEAIARLAAGYDMVALQEADAGSLRSGFINQSRYIADHAELPFWHHQANRRLGNMSVTGNGFVGRFQPEVVEEHRLPGAIPGRGCLLLRFGGSEGLVFAVVHLALGRRARGQQLSYLARQLAGERRLVVMGDLNTEATSPEIRSFCDALDLHAPTAGLASYPAWQPQRSIDHILVSEQMEISDARIIAVPMSDHCPVELTLVLPPDLSLEPSDRRPAGSAFHRAPLAAPPAYQPAFR